MASFLSSLRAMKGQALGGETPGLSNALSTLSCNSPGKLRVMKSRKATRSSPYGGKRTNSFRSSALLGFEDDARSLLSPDRPSSSAFVADKHVGIRVVGGEPAHGLKLQTDPVQGVIVSGMDREGQAAKNGMLVGDIIFAIDANPVSTDIEAMQILSTAPEGSRLTITASGSTRTLTLDKTKGDLGMTCAQAAHSPRGVMLKRIQKGSLADAAALYCGDSIISVNEQLVHRHDQAVSLMNQAKGEVRLVIWGTSTEVTVKKEGESKLGITVTNHDQPTDGPGVKIVKVDFDGRAARAGLSAGDALMSVNGVICTDHAQAIKLLDATADEAKIVFMNK